MSFSISVALLIFCLEDLSIDVSGVLKSCTVIVFPSIFLFMSVNICFMYLSVPILGACILMSVVSSSSFFFFFLAFWATPVAYGGSQVRG